VCEPSTTAGLIFDGVCCAHILTTPGKPGVKAIVLVPTRELCVQTQDAIGQLCRYCRDVVTILALSHSSVADQAAQLLNQPDILISTPGRLAKHLKAGVYTSCGRVV